MEQIPNHSRYLISDCGVIFDDLKEEIMNQSTNNCGYKVVNVYDDDGVRKTFQVGNLVALTYLPNPNQYPHCDHIDRNRTNNKVSNLRWASVSQNAYNRSITSRNVLGVKNISFTNDRYFYTKSQNYQQYKKSSKKLNVVCFQQYIHSRLVKLNGGIHPPLLN